MNPGYPEEIKAMLRGTSVCLNCGRPLKYYARDNRRSTGYCSYDCYLAKPPKMAWVEKQYNQPIRELLVDVLNGATVEASAHRLCITRQAMYAWIKKLRIRRTYRWTF